MSGEDVDVFFYGLFMDESWLASMGIHPSRSRVGYVHGYALRIGARATLVHDAAGRAYGVLMTIRPEDLAALYSEKSVADYVAVPVSVVLPDGTCEPAVCYNLPDQDPEGEANSTYASSLLLLADRLGFPDDYLQQIRKAADQV